MKFEDYLTQDETILFKKIFGPKKALAGTNKRIMYYKVENRFVEYGDIPLSKLSYIRTGWSKFRKGRLLGGFFVLLIGFLLLYFLSNLIYAYYIFLPFLLISLILIITAFKQYGYLIINDKIWGFEFNKRFGQEGIQEFIKWVYQKIA